MTSAVIYDTLRKAYWRPNAAGYTDDIRQAGLYSLQEIAERDSRLSCRSLVPLPADRPSRGEAEAAAGPSKLPTGFPCGSLPVSLGTDATLPAAAASGASHEGSDWRGQSRRDASMGNSRVVHCKRDQHDVYIGRPSKWGNPFVIGKDGTRDEVIAKYEAWLRRQPELMALLSELKGKVLGCWCSPQACHGDVLARLAEEVEAV